MATNENRPPESIPFGGTGAAGSAASAFERPIPEPVAPLPTEVPEVAIYRPGEPRTRLVSFSRAAGHYLGATVRTFRSARRQSVRERAENMVREYPASLAGAAAAGYIVGRVLKGR
jgi:hypothetical protein